MSQSANQASFKWIFIAIWLGIFSCSLEKPAVSEVKSSANKGFDRIYFKWPKKVEYSAQRFGKKLLLEFGKPIQGSVEKLTLNLGKYIKSAQSQEGGKEIVIELTGRHRFNVFRDGNSVILDVGPNRKSKKKKQTKSIAKKSIADSTDKYKVSVRVGKHEDYHRVVFDWSDKTGYSIEETSETVKINFGRFAAVNDEAVKKKLPADFSKFISTKTKEGFLGVSLSKVASLNIRHFAAGNKVVVDFLKVKKKNGLTSSADSAVDDNHNKLDKPVSKNADLAKTLGLRSHQNRTTGEKVNSQSAGAASIAKSQVQPEQANSPNREKKQPPISNSLGKRAVLADASEFSKMNKLDIISNPKWQVIKDTVAPQNTASGLGLDVQLVRNNNADSLRFEWDSAVPSAVFTRAGYLWIVFDESVSFNLSKIKEEKLKILSKLSQIPSKKGSVFRAKLVDGISASVWRDGPAWVIDLAPQLSRPDVALKFVTQQTSPQGPRIFILAEGIGEAITIQDPEVGDRLFVVPITPLSRGIKDRQTFAQFNLLQTTQGIVIQPLIDELEVRVMPDGVAITASQFRGLEVSDRSKAAGQKALSVRRADGLPGGLEPGRIFNLDAWRQGAKPAQFLEFKQNIQHQISQATSIARSGPRLSLAQFYFAKGLSAETMGLLRTISGANEDLARRPDVIALRGASQFILGRFEEAEKELDDRSLNGFSEAELWRGASNAAQGKWAAAIEHFARAGEIPGDYPRNFSTQLALWAAEAAIRAEDYRGAGVFLDAIAEGRPTAGEQARLNYLRGRVLYASNDIPTALNYWRRLVDGPDRWARVRARRALIEHNLQTNTIARTEAIESLERLRFAWRGDQLEFDLLRRLGDLYLEENDYVSGLTALRQAVTFFPNNVEARKVSKKMMNRFSSIYTDGVSDSMTPLTALSMYDQFRELTPVGRRGDRIIQRLADRLVEVDLLDRASILLDRQVKFRLQGVQKAKVGSKLALIRLLDRQPGTALKALDESVAPGLGPKLALERKRLRSRSVFELGDSQSALKLVRGDTSRDADLLRADIYWRTQEWKKAAVVFQRLIGNAGTDGRRLSDLSATLIVNWVVALSMSEQKESLNEARQVYAAMMDATRYREAFRLITNKTAGDLQDFRTLTERFQEIGRFQAFLTSYREKLKDKPLSEVN